MSLLYGILSNIIEKKGKLFGYIYPSTFWEGRESKNIIRMPLKVKT